MMNFQSTDSLLQLAFFLYAASVLGYLRHFFYQKPSGQKFAWLLLTGGVLAHGSAVICQVLSMKALPVYTLTQNLTLAGLILGVIFLFCQYVFHFSGLGIFVSASLCSVLGAALVLPHTIVQPDHLLSGFWLYSHIVFSFSGDAALALAAGASSLYLVQERSIKNKKTGFFFQRLSPLDSLDEMSSVFLGVGFCLFTFGLVTGFIYAKAVWGRFWGWDVKEFFSLFAWCMYAGLLHCRLHVGWRGRRTAIMNILGFLVLLFTFLGVNLFLGGHHQGFTR